MENALTLGLPESSETSGTRLVVKLLPLFPTTILVGLTSESTLALMALVAKLGLKPQRSSTAG
jgi:hypothetical protein